MILEAVVCLALNIYNEARGEPVDGQIAVAQVTLNRVADPRYPDTVCEVVYDPDQFSWTNHPFKIKNTEALFLALVIAEGVMEGTFDDFTGGATHYYAPAKAQPYWSKKLSLIGKIGDHIFMVEK